MTTDSSTDSTETNTSDITPRTDTLDAWRVLINPNAYGKFALVDLIERGFNTWREEKGQVRDEAQMFADAQKYALEAIKNPDLGDVVENPWVSPDKPGRLVVLHALGVTMIKRNKRLKDQDHRIGLHHYLRDVFAYHVYAAMNHSEHRDKIQLEAGEAILSRDQQDQRGPPAKRPVTAIKQVEELGDKMYFEVPLVHANRNCIVRDEDPVNGEIKSRIANNCIYIPEEAFQAELNDYLMNSGEGVIQYWERAFANTLTDEQLNTISENAPDVDKKIERLQDAGQTQKLYTERQYPERLRCILKAVDMTPNAVASLGEFIEAEDVFDAVNWFYEQEPDDLSDGDDGEDDSGQTIKEYEQDQLEEFETTRSIAIFLQNQSKDHPHVELNREGRNNTYKLQYSPWGNAKNVNVSEIGDLHELPCLQNLHEYLQHDKPVRWILYSYARIIFSLKNDFGVEDIVDEFEQYSWFDEDTTRYQAEYERDRKMPSGEDPLPISCSNDNQQFSQFCIGRENCDYSIYRSLPFKQEVYDQTSDSGSDVL